MFLCQVNIVKQDLICDRIFGRLVFFVTMYLCAFTHYTGMTLTIKISKVK